MRMITVGQDHRHHIWQSTISPYTFCRMMCVRLRLWYQVVPATRSTSMYLVVSIHDYITELKTEDSSTGISVLENYISTYSYYVICPTELPTIETLPGVWAVFEVAHHAMLCFSLLGFDRRCSIIIVHQGEYTALHHTINILSWQTPDCRRLLFEQFGIITDKRFQ